uniref:hypothetical protein n=1 Tax=Algoriphagus sp. TaxID=1872435 RepID=UPI004047BDD5
MLKISWSATEGKIKRYSKVRLIVRNANFDFGIGRFYGLAEKVSRGLIIKRFHADLNEKETQILFFMVRG